MAVRDPKRILNIEDGIDIDDSPLMLGGDRAVDDDPAVYANRLQVYAKRVDGFLDLYVRDDRETSIPARLTVRGQSPLLVNLSEGAIPFGAADGSFDYDENSLSFDDATNTLAVDNVAAELVDSTNYTGDAATITDIDGTTITASGQLRGGSLGIGQDVSGATKIGATTSDTIASGASVPWDAISFITGTATLTGATNITLASGFNYFNINAPSINAGSALTITNAATFTIKGAPVGGGVGPVTITNAYALWVQSGNVRFDGQTLVKQGLVTSPGLAFQGGATDGLYQRAATVVDVAANGVFQAEFGNNFLTFGNTIGIRWLASASPGGSVASTLVLDDTAILAIKNSTIAQALRIYGNTTGSHYLSLTHDGTNGVLSVNGGGDLTSASHLLPSTNAEKLLGSSLLMWASVNATAFRIYVTPGDAQPGTSLTNGQLGFGAGGAAQADVVVVRDASAILAIKNGTTAQTLRVYGTTTGSRYSELSHDGTNGYFKTSSGSARIEANSNEVYIVRGDSAQTLYIYGATTGQHYVKVGHNGTNGFLGAIGGGNMLLQTGGATRVTIAGGSNTVTFAGVTLTADGANTAPSYAFTNATGTGMYLGAPNSIYFSANGTAGLRILGGGVGVVVASTGALVFSSSGVTANATDPAIKFIAAGVCAAVNVTDTNPTAFRVYGTSTGPKYVELRHNGTTGFVTAVGSGSSLNLEAQAGNNLNLGDTGGAKWTLNNTNNRLVAQSNYGFAHGTSALATTATEGFFHLQSCAGAPTGVPASIPSGQIPAIYDSSNNRIYFYTGGAWRYKSVDNT